MAKKQTQNKNNATLAKSDDGGIQITFTIPFAVIADSRLAVAKNLQKDATVSGFRKGNAPLDIVMQQIPKNTLTEKALALILPKLIGEAIDKHRLQLAMYPKLELIKADENEDWQVRAVTAELPQFELGDYKKEITGSARAKAIWTPGKDKQEQKKGLSQEEKEQEVIKILLNSIKVNPAKILIEEEANAHLSQLLEKLEKLGLNLDSYLASIGKTAQKIREDYEDQAKTNIAMDLILSKIANEENVTIDQIQVDDALKASIADPSTFTDLNTPERRRLVESVLRKRQVLKNLTNLLS